VSSEEFAQLLGHGKGPFILPKEMAERSFAARVR